jgi:predicted neutral ceramidase superfamily lipid hydrolase
MNKNLLIAGIFGFIASAVIAELYALYSPSDVLTSTVTVLVGFIIYKTAFVVLFHIDNKQKYTNRLTSEINFNILKPKMPAISKFLFIKMVSRYFL